MLGKDFKTFNKSIINYPTNSWEWNIHGWACDVIRTAVLPFFYFFRPHFLFTEEKFEEKNIKLFFLDNRKNMKHSMYDFL
jgi:hypothetical protein